MISSKPSVPHPHRPPSVLLPPSPHFRQNMRAHAVAALFATWSLAMMAEAKPKQQLPCPKDPFADPKNDPCNV
jgi:hypothetical protein